jgi:hypothetical protein
MPALSQPPPHGALLPVSLSAVPPQPHSVPSLDFALGGSGADGDVSDSSSDSEDEDEVTTANEADSEESVTSEGESTPGTSPGPDTPASQKEKWVAVKGTPTAMEPMSVHAPMPAVVMS